MSGRERTIRKLIAWIATMLFHRVEVRQPHGLTASGPMLVNASHFGGFSDPLVLIRAMDRVPRFIGRDVIWKFPIVRNIADWFGAIPVHKSDDGGQSSNDQMFSSTYAALAAGDLVTIFPEGITVDDPQIAHIKTGSARIALGARASGVENITILSAGIHYENKAALRSEVLVDVGYGFSLDEWVADNIPVGESQDASNRAAVVALTEEMERRLRWAAPDFDSWAEARDLTTASDIALRKLDRSTPEVGHGDRERLARLLDDASDARKSAVSNATTTYQSELDALGVDDRTLVSSLGTKPAFLWNILKDIIAGLLILPFALVGLIINVIPMALVWLIGRAKVDDAMMATIKPLGALFVFSLTWSLWLWWAGSAVGLGFVAAMLVLLPFYLFSLIALFERLTLLFAAIRLLTRARSVTQVYEQLHNDRNDVVEAVAQAV